MQQAFRQLLADMFDERQKLNLVGVYFLACFWFSSVYVCESVLKADFEWGRLAGIVLFALLIGGIFWGALLLVCLGTMNKWCNSVWVRYGVFIGVYVFYVFSDIYPAVRDWDSFVSAYYRFYKKREGLNYFLLNPLMLALFSAFWIELFRKLYVYLHPSPEDLPLPALHEEVLDDSFLGNPRN